MILAEAAQEVPAEQRALVMALLDSEPDRIDRHLDRARADRVLAVLQGDAPVAPALIDSFPGTAPLHWAAHLAAARSMEWTAAQSRLRVARLLSPDNPVYVSAEMLLIPRCNPPEVALSRCRWLYREWGGRSGRVAHAYAVALLRLRPIFPDVFEEAYEAASRAFRLLPRDLSSQGIILVGLLRDYRAWKLKTPGFSKPDPIRLGDEDSFVLILPDPEMKEFETSLLELSEAA